jgi:hypothetical protein
LEKIFRFGVMYQLSLRLTPISALYALISNPPLAILAI